MNIVQKYMTQNDCYKANQRLVSVEYLIVHSTATLGIMAADWYIRWNKSDVAKCVHAFVDDQVVMQYLPWDWRAWQIGTAWGNSHSIGCEMCEDKLWEESYFLKAKRNMVELYAMLAVKYNVPVKKIVGHYEAYQLGIGSNHGDPQHWWKKFNYTMDDFRAEVVKEMESMEVLKLGMTGTSVKTLQENLQKLGYILEADGSYGPGTVAIVKKFQTDNKLVVDGIAGPGTQAKIAELLKPAPVVVPGPEELWKCSMEIDNLTFAQAKALKAQYPDSAIVIE